MEDEVDGCGWPELGGRTEAVAVHDGTDVAAWVCDGAWFAMMAGRSASIVACRDASVVANICCCCCIICCNEFATSARSLPGAGVGGRGGSMSDTSVSGDVERNLAGRCRCRWGLVDFLRPLAFGILKRECERQ